jgi:hypothetical protein
MRQSLPSLAERNGRTVSAACGRRVLVINIGETPVIRDF